jgi:hypothetical protein
VGNGHDEMTGLRFGDITHPEDLDADLAQAGQLLAGEITTYPTQKRYSGRTGRSPAPSSAPSDVPYRLLRSLSYAN